MAWAGAEYGDDKPDPVYTTEEILAAMNLKPENKPGLMIDWIVGAIAAQARRDKVPKQYKPWPNPLPDELPLNLPVDATYIGGEDADEIVLDPATVKWLENTEAEPIWPEVDWATALNIEANVGLLDDPYLAQQHVLTVDLSSDPLVVFGSAGRGKSTFVKTLLTTLAETHTPEALHLYALDFARGGLKALRSLPHMAGIVDVNEEERVERLLRMVRNTIDERQKKIQAYDSLTEYNLKNPDEAFPAVVVVVDNVSEFKETYDKYLPDLIALIRDGRSFGVYFVITAALTNDVPNKLFNLLSQRITYTLPDPGEYTTVVGRGWPRFNDTPGRGLAVQTLENRPVPLEFQTAIPVGEAGTDAYRELAQRMEAAWAKVEAADPAARARRPKPVEPLPSLVPLQTVLPPFGSGKAGTLTAAVGINDMDREPLVVDFEAKGPHWIVIGPPVTGKSTILRSLVLSLAQTYTPEQVAMVLVDPSDTIRRFYTYGGSQGNSLAELPHVLATVSNAKEMDEVVKRLTAEYDEAVIGRLASSSQVYAPQDNDKRAIFVILDHYDDIEPMNKGELGLAGLSLVGKGRNMHIVIGGTLGIMRASGDDLRRRAESARYTLVLQDYETVRYMGARGNFSLVKEPPPGRGFQVKAVSVALTQMAIPVVDGLNGQSAQEQLDSMIGAIRAAYTPAKWSYFGEDLALLDKAIRGEAPEPEAPAPDQTEVDAQKMLDELMASQSAMMDSLNTAIPDADPNRFATVVEPDTEPDTEAGDGQAAAAGNGKGAKSAKGNGAKGSKAETEAAAEKEA